MSERDLKEAAKGLPANWKVFYSKKSNRLYYFNDITRKTQWNHPNADGKKVRYLVVIFVNLVGK